MLRNRFYYLVKPFLPRSLRLSVRRWWARRKLKSVRDQWPILPGSETRPTGWKGWPNGYKFAFVLTHDVESQIGMERVRELAKLEMSLGCRSSFNFIPQGSYETPAEVREYLSNHGFEIGVHDFEHDGMLYHSRTWFSRNARGINRSLKDWGAVGFRSGFMLNRLDWLHELNIEYDASTFDTDPFEPEPEGRETIFPFLVEQATASKNGDRPQSKEGYIELPYTLPQDSTLFLLLGEKSPEIWMRKVDWIAEHGGMVLLNTHPDYMDFVGENSPYSFPVCIYQELLEYVRDRYGDACWKALPKDVAAFARSQLQQ
jgi:hypothetical protein